MKPVMFVFALVGVLLGAALFIPSNTLTGHVIQDGPCKGLGCSELCNPDANVVLANIDTSGQSGTQAGVQEMTCSKGTVCCPTHWDSGVCDYPVNCEKIRQYSLYQSLDSYQDSVREKPAPVDADPKTFFLPLIIILGIIAYFAYKRNDPTIDHR